MGDETISSNNNKSRSKLCPRLKDATYHGNKTLWSGIRGLGKAGPQGQAGPAGTGVVQVSTPEKFRFARLSGGEEGACTGVWGMSILGSTRGQRPSGGGGQMTRSRDSKAREAEIGREAGKPMSSPSWELRWDSERWPPCSELYSQRTTLTVVLRRDQREARAA